MRKWLFLLTLLTSANIVPKFYGGKYLRDILEYSGFISKYFGERSERAGEMVVWADGGVDRWWCGQMVVWTDGGVAARCFGLQQGARFISESRCKVTAFSGGGQGLSPELEVCVVKVVALAGAHIRVEWKSDFEFDNLDNDNLDNGRMRRCQIVILSSCHLVIFEIGKLNLSSIYKIIYILASNRSFQIEFDNLTFDNLDKVCAQ